MELKIHRDGQEATVRYPLSIKNSLVPILHGVECWPEYFIVGGVVFIPLSYPFLEHAFGKLRPSLPLHLPSTVSGLHDPCPTNCLLININTNMSVFVEVK